MYVGSSQSEVLNTKPDYQKILQNQTKLFDCMELVMDELQGSVKQLHAFMDESTQCLQEVSVQLGKRSTQQLDPSPARKLLKLQLQKQPSTYCSKSCQWPNAAFLPQGALEERNRKSAPVHGGLSCDICSVAFEDNWLTVKHSDFFLKMEFMHLKACHIQAFSKNRENAWDFALEWPSELVAHSLKYPLWSEISLLWRCFWGFETT